MNNLLLRLSEDLEATKKELSATREILKIGNYHIFSEKAKMLYLNLNTKYEFENRKIVLFFLKKIFVFLKYL